MSGGVDSSAAAVLTLSRGYDCIGATMKLHSEPDNINGRTCCTAEDSEDARGVCAKLGINYYVFNFQSDFKKEVMDRFVRAYENGFTPNPCIDCNRYLKFERLYRRAGELGCGYIVTGHYARTEYNKKTGRWLLKKAVCAEKDQSYVLYSLSQEKLSHTLFPLGELKSKSEARRIAEEAGLLNAKKRESQDICFIPDGNYSEFIRRYTGKGYPKGKFIDRNGSILGEHNGIISYTIGQRKGIGISFNKPMYVTGKSAEDNTVTLGDEKDLYTGSFIVSDFNLISMENFPNYPVKVTVKTRYSSRPAPAYAEDSGRGKVKITFEEPQRAIALGQAAVLYDDDIVVGGGTITKS